MPFYLSKFSLDRATLVDQVSALRVPRVVPDDDGLDTVEVPAAVVCARCGRPDCAGCYAVEEPTQPSGIVAIIAWERPGASAWSRLWTTARVATLNADTFCASLPSGDLAPPLRFAFACEFLAVGSLALFVVGILFAVVPSVALTVLHNQLLRSLFLRLFVVVVPSLASILVLAHLALGLGFDLGASKTGSRSARTRALRFGLYSTGWDLLRSSPIGLIYLLVDQGPIATVKLLPSLFHVPTRGAVAFLKGTYRLEGDELTKVGNLGVQLAFGISVAAVVALFVVLAIVAILPV